jgi:hypothetical protein
MKKHLGVAVAVALFAGATHAQTETQVLEGDERTACEVILCLSSGKRPSECTPPLNRYFSIKRKKLSDTLSARRDFLDLCPAAKESSEMRSLVSALANGGGRCDAAALNADLTAWNSFNEGTQYISNAMPGYCSTYINHPYTNLADIAPRYVGNPAQGGYWVEAAQYEQALAQYNAQLAAAQNYYYNQQRIGDN